MDLYIRLGLFLALCAAASTSDAPKVSEYIPKLAKPPSKLQSSVTSSSFILDQPQDIFNQYTTTNVWLLVKKSSAPDPNSSALVPYSSFINNISKWYHTLPRPAADYPTSNNGILYLIHVGSEKCTGNQYCNGPLSNADTYRVKFVLLDSNGLFNETRWSDNITLSPAPSPSAYLTIASDTQSRSGGMIVLTSILSVLLGILLICFIVALAAKCKGMCWTRTLLLTSHEDNYGKLVTGSYKSRYEEFSPSSL